MLLRNVFSNWVALLVIGAISFLLTPFMIHRLGDFEYGVYTLAFSVVGYSDLLEQGIRNTLLRFVARLSGRGDREGLDSVFSTAVALALAIAAVMVVGCLGLSYILPGFFHLSAERQILFARLVILLGLNVGVAVPALLLGSYLAGLQRFDLYNIGAIIRMACRAALILVVLLRGKHVLAVAVCILISTVISIPVNAWMIRKVDPRLKMSPRLVRLRTARELFTFSFWTLLNNAGQLLRDSTDSIVIGRVLGAAFITPFAVAARLVDYFRPIIRDMVSPLLPRFSELDGQGKQEEIRHLFLRMTRFSAIASLAIGSILLLNGRTLLLLWVGERYVSSYPVLVLLTVGALSSLVQFGTLDVLVAMGRHRAYGLWTLGEGLANLVLSVIWGHQYGIVGVALGTAVPLLAVKLTLQPWYVMRIIHMSLGEYLGKALARPLAICLVFLAFCGKVGGFEANSSIWHLLYTVAWQAALFAILAFTIGLEGSDRTLLRGRFARLAWTQ